MSVSENMSSLSERGSDWQHLVAFISITTSGIECDTAYKKNKLLQSPITYAESDNPWRLSTFKKNAPPEGRAGRTPLLLIGRSLHPPSPRRLRRVLQAPWSQDSKPNGLVALHGT